MKQIPSTIVFSILLLIFASWPSISAWGEHTLARHLALHACYLVSGCLFGLQLAWWAARDKTGYIHNEESRVIS